MIKKATNVQYGYTIEGNTIQDGVPSPNSPIIPQGTGDRTRNLCPNTSWSSGQYRDGVWETTNTRSTSEFFPVSSNQYRLKINSGQLISFINFNYFDNQKQWLGNRATLGMSTFSPTAQNIVIPQLPSNAAYMRITIRFYNDNGNPPIPQSFIDDSNIMVSEGTSEPSYEPYGYKIPITSVGENLFDKNAEGVTSGKYVNGDGEEISSPNWKISDYIKITGNAVTISGVGGNAPAICAYDENKDYVRGTVYLSGSAQNLTTVTIATIGCKYVRFSYQSFMNPMLNLGPTALPYKPYIEPIEADIYLGQVQTTRNIKKLMLDGTEVWQFYEESRGTWQFYINDIGLGGVTKSSAMSNIAPYGATTDTRHNYDYGCYLVTSGGGVAFQMKGAKDTFPTVTAWKAYLAAQYAAGTPVCVWYVLATPEVSITNEPLMKIGNYVDKINNTQSGIDITTNNLTVNTIIPPSDISINTTATWVPIPYNKYNTETISTIAPIDFLSNGQNITVDISGDTEQIDVPSPSNIVMPQGTGERTENLWDGAKIENCAFQTGIYTIPIYSPRNIIYIPVIGGNTYTFSINNITPGTSFQSVCSIDKPALGVSYYINEDTTFVTHGEVTTFTRTIPNEANWWAIQIMSLDNLSNNIMINEGSTALPYEPYGYKIPISSDGENLFDKDNTIIYNAYFNTAGDWLLSEDSKSIKFPCLPNTQYTLSVPSTLTVFRIYESSNPNLEPLASTGNRATAITRNSDIREYTFTTSSTAQILLFQGSNGEVDEWFNGLMLVKGSTAKPYSPYNHTTTPVYLGGVETIRKIGKIDLGTLSWSITASGNFWADTSIPNCRIIGNSSIGNAICTHFTEVSANNVANTPYSFSSCLNTQARPFINKTGFENMSTTEFKEAMSGVYIYYVLTTPTTGIVNEPLMKIGDYVDEISNITIPTTKGSNTLSINTSVQPSNVQLSIFGWVPHNNIKEYKNNAWMATSWEGFRDIVRAGNGPTRYPIGTKLYETWGDNTSNAWIIVDYDNSNYNDPDISALGYTHNVVLYEEKINYLKVFDNTEAWLYTESVLPAGTYRFTIPNYDTTYGGNKTYIFTSTVDVPIHGQLTLSWPYQQNPVSVSAYTTNVSTTALFTATVSEWDGTTTSEDLGTIKLAMTDSDSTYGKLNHIHRARYGSNNYYQSGIRQWMNADAAANNWWKPTNIFDRPYSNRTSDGGLYLMDEDFRKVIAAPNITCITNNIFETGTSGSTAFKLQTQYTIRDKIFLPTHTELNLSSNPNIGTVFSQYTNAGNDDRIKYRKDNGNAYYYWFRTPYPSYGNGVRYVSSSGALSSYAAYNTTGAVLACIIQ